MSDPFIGEIRMVGFNYAPAGWVNCDGQLAPVSQNAALFSLLGTTYGGDGVNTFALPDLRGRVPINVGTGPGLTPRQQGEKGGQEQVALQETEVATGGRTNTNVNVGASTSLPNMQPYLCVRFIIAIQGMYPPRH
jgi:microcystin-dependent protein